MGEPVWCETCRRGIVRALDDLGVAAMQLYRDARVGTAGGWDGDQVTGSRARPSASPLLDELDETARWLAPWGRYGREPDPDLPDNLGALLNHLWAVQSRLGALLADPGIGVELGKAILMRSARLVRRAKTGEQKRRKPVPCPRCDSRLLVHEDGRDYVQCDGCHYAVKLDYYHELARVYLRQREAESGGHRRKAGSLAAP